MRVLAVVVVCGLCACSGGSDGASARFPDGRLQTLAGVPGPPLSSCPTRKCLTVLVAPWCGICHAAAPDIVRLRKWLDFRGVPSRIVVGASDDLGQIRSFAREFGPDSLLDPGQSLKTRSVPFFLVSGSDGRIEKTMSGFPRSADPEDLARYLNLLD